MARRVNIKFLGVLTGSIVGVLVAAVIIQKLVVRQRPEDLVQLGKMYMADRNYREAIKNFGAALGLRSGDPEIAVLLGDAWHQQTRFEPEIVGRDKGAWNRALEADPRHMPALQRLLNAYWQDAQLPGYRQDQTLYNTIGELAARIVEIDPKDTRAESFIHIAVVQGWINGLTTDAKKVEEAIAALESLCAKDRTNAEIPFFAARAKIFRAQELLRLNQRQEAEKLMEESAALFEVGIKEQSQSAVVHYRAAQVYLTMARTTDNRELRSKYEKRGAETLDRARALLTPKDPWYVETNMLAAEIAAGENDNARAERILRDLLANRPEEIGIRLTLARLLGVTPAKRQEAIALLDVPVTAAEGMIGTQVLQLRSLETQGLMQLADLRLESAAAEKDSARRKELIAQAEESYKRVENRLGETAEILKLRGKLLALQGQSIEAIQTYDRANMLFKQQGRWDGELVYALARAYLDANQTGEAKNLLRELVARHEKFIPARVLLAQILLRENNMAEAKLHLDFLEAALPDEPQILQLRLASLDPVNQKDQVKTVYGRLPEKDAPTRLLKARAALSLGNAADAQRLLRANIAADAADVESVQSLATLLATTGKKAEAKLIVAEGLKRKPDHRGLKILDKQLDEASPEELQAFIREDIEQISDEYLRELQLFRLANEQGKRQEAMAHLKAAEKAKPDSGQVMELLFQFHLAQQEWDQATAYMDKLVKMNQDRAGGLLYRFRFAIAKNQADEALSIGRELTQKLPEFSQSWLAYGQALQVAGQYSDALSKFTLALEKQSDNAEAMRGLIDSFYALDRPGDALRYIQAGRKSFPTNAYFREREIEHELNFGDPEKAIGPRQAAMKNAPENPQVWLALGGAYLRVAQHRAAQGKADDVRQYLGRAREHFEQAAAKWPDELRFNSALVETLAAMGDETAARAALARMESREAWKNKPEPQLMLADVLTRAGKRDEAESALRLALERSGGKIEVQQRLAGFLSAGGKYDEALKTLEANAEDARIRRQRIDVMLAAGRVADAEAALKAAIEKNPREADLPALLGFIYLNSGKMPEAQQQVSAALAIDGRNLNARYFQGLIRLRQPRPDANEALKELLIVEQQNPNNPDVRLAMAEAYRMKNDGESAIRELETALRLAPMSKAVRLRLVDLYANSRPPRWTDAERLLAQSESMQQFAGDGDFANAAAMMWLSRGDGARSLERIQQALKAAPGNPQFVRNFLQILLATRNFEAVLQQTDGLIAQKMDPWWIYQMRAIARKQLNQKEEAMGEFEAALRQAETLRNDDLTTSIVQTIAREIGVDEALNRVVTRAQTDNRWRLVAAYLYHSIPDDVKAVRMVELVLADLEVLAPAEQERALRLAGMIYLTARPKPLVDKAYRAYLQLLDRTPEDYAALNNLACLLAESMNPPRPEQARIYSQRAFDLMQKSGTIEPLIMDTHGWILVLCGRVEEGITILQQVVDRRPFPEAHYHLAEAYMKKSYPEEAQKQLLAATEIMDRAARAGNVADAGFKTKVKQALDKADELIKARRAAVAPATQAAAP